MYARILVNLDLSKSKPQHISADLEKESYENVLCSNRLSKWYPNGICLNQIKEENPQEIQNREGILG